jgi:hypothetical protein
MYCLKLILKEDSVNTSARRRRVHSLSWRAENGHHLQHADNDMLLI